MIAYLYAICVAVVMGFGGYGLHSYYANKAEANYRNQLEVQQAQLKNQCLLEKNISNEVSYGYQKELSNIDGIADDAISMLHGQACITVRDGGAFAGYYDSSATKKPASRRVGDAEISAEQYIKLFKKAAKYQAQLKGCQAWILKTQASTEKVR